MGHFGNINKYLKENKYPPIEEIGNIKNWNIYRSIKEVGDKRFFFIASIDKSDGWGSSEIELHKVLTDKIKVRDRNYKLVPYEITLSSEIDEFENISKTEKYLLDKLEELNK